MKMVITAKCGHKEEIEVTGNQKNRDRQIWSAEHSDCTECSQRKMEARDAAAGLADLEGSEKQIAWAKSIRRGIIEKIEAAPMGSAENEKIKADIVTAMKNNRSAKWWIDVRDMTLVNVIREVLKGAN
nr:MAG TPA: hypothetical protein [Bacteriophage sp.]